MSVRGRITQMSDNCFEWMVPNIASLAPNLRRFQSPQFKSCGAAWIILLEEPKKNVIYVRLIKESWDDVKSFITYKLSVKKSDGVEYASLEHKQKFFSCRDISSKFITLHVSEFSRSDISPEAALTVSCNLAYERYGAEPTNAKMSTNCLGRLQHDLKDLLLSEEDSDVVIRVTNQEFRAHKAILRARSPVFRSMFLYDMTEGNSGYVDITDCDPTAFRYFLFFLYNGTVEELSADKVLDLYSIADKYDVRELQDKCVEFMMENMSVDTFCEMFTVTLQHNESALMEKAICFFIENGLEIIATVNWLSFLKKYPIEANELYMKAWRMPRD